MRRLSTVLLPLLLLGCGSSGTETTLTLTQLPTDAGPEARVLVKLWGYDRSLADAAASPIGFWQLPLDASGVFQLDIPEDPHTLIDQGQGPVPASEAGFYFKVYVDLDGDGQLCPGDLHQDYDVTDQEFYDAVVPSSITVALAPFEAGRPCEPAPTGS